MKKYVITEKVLEVARKTLVSHCFANVESQLGFIISYFEPKGDCWIGDINRNICTSSECHEPIMAREFLNSLPWEFEENEGYFIEHDGTGWRSIFPSNESECSFYHVSISDAYNYMANECGVTENIMIITPQNNLI